MDGLLAVGTGRGHAKRWEAMKGLLLLWLLCFGRRRPKEYGSKVGPIGEAGGDVGTGFHRPFRNRPGGSAWSVDVAGFSAATVTAAWERQSSTCSARCLVTWECGDNSWLLHPWSGRDLGGVTTVTPCRMRESTLSGNSGSPLLPLTTSNGSKAREQCRLDIAPPTVPDKGSAGRPEGILKKCCTRAQGALANRPMAKDRGFGWEYHIILGSVPANRGYV